VRLTCKKAFDFCQKIPQTERQAENLVYRVRISTLL